MFSKLQLSTYSNSVTQSRPTLCDPMNRSTPGLPVHQFPGRLSEILVNSQLIRAFNKTSFEQSYDYQIYNIKEEYHHDGLTIVSIRVQLEDHVSSSYSGMTWAG